MKQRSFIALATTLFLLLAGAISVYAYDSTRDDLVAEGITAGGVDIGGMRADEARRAIERRVAAPLRRPLRVRHGDRSFTLSPERARLRVDVGGMVSEALRRSRSGNVVTRTVRGLAGSDVHARVRTRTSYSQAAVDGLVKRVRLALDRKPRDARVQFSAAGPNPVRGQYGRAVRVRVLRRAIARELSRPAGDRSVTARLTVRKPKVTMADLADRYPTVIVVNRGGFQLKLYRRLKLARSYRIAVGQVGLETPAGLYSIQNKAVNPAWHVPNRDWAGDLAGKVIPGGRADNPLKARWMGIYNGAGIHGTAAVGSLGTAASHGCIRMAIPDVIELYQRVETGTPVYIA